MVVVMETWHLKPGFEDRAVEVMQEYDNLVGPPAHEHPGWCGHGRFFQSAADPSALTMLYPWRSRELHEDLTANEEKLLPPIYEKYCARPREIRYYQELAVEVEHDHEHEHG
jgi:heme-degrading monooxygenase HmoA